MKEKETLKSLALNKLKNGALIYQLLESEELDNIIKKVNQKNRERFLDNLTNFIDYFNYVFAPLNYKEACIALVLNHEANFLLSKKKWNIKNLKYYIKEYKKTILKAFLENMQFLGEIDILNSPRNFEFFRELIWCNYYYNRVIDVLFVSYKDRLNSKIVNNLKNKSKIADYNKLKENMKMILISYCIIMKN